MGVQAFVFDEKEMGYFRIYVTPPGGTRREITYFREIPVTVSRIDTQDPFTDASMQIQLPQVTAWDIPGSGDLDWFVEYALIEVVWQNVNGYGFDWTFEGQIHSDGTETSESTSMTTLEIKGALLLLDNYLAAPTYPPQPVPYEHLMKDAFDQKKHPAFLAPFSVEWPTVDGWDRRVPSGNEFDELYKYAQTRPWGVVQGQRWTGFTTRSTGSWEPLVTGFVQGLLSVMFEEGGHQWTIRKDKGRKPVLYLREIAHKSDDDMLFVDLGAPGVSQTLNRDFTQSANTFYGEGQDTAGSSYSGANVTADGSQTFYTPFAFQPSVWPIDPATNGSRNDRIMPKEAHIKFPSGMDFVDSQALARGQMARFAEPGYVGTITLKSDPQLPDGTLFPRLLLKAGRSICLRGFRGQDVVFHISAASVDIGEGITTTLTVDSKYRDQLTVAEVQARTRDALTPLRSLQVGAYSNTISDLLLPWSYAQGSGVIPSGAEKNAKDFFTKYLPASATFPYEEYTKKYPPKSAIGRSFYIPLGKVNRTNSNSNWARTSRGLGWPIRMSQSGSSRLVQIAAYRADGTVFPVRFHVSFYGNRGINVTSMPRLPGTAGGNPNVPYLKAKGGDTFRAGQANPFFQTAWEQVKEDGTQYDSPYSQVAEGADLILGYGTYYEPGGYWPGRASRGDAPTGLLVDEVSWSWDMSSDPTFDPLKTNQSDQTGYIYAMIYCDYQGDEPIYFMGRIFRQEAT